MFGKHGKANAVKLPADLPQTLSRVVDSDRDTDNRTCAMSCLNSIAVDAPCLVLADNSIIACALRVVQEQGTGAAPPPPSPTPPSSSAASPLSSSPAACHLLFNRIISPSFCIPLMQI
jgi:hypothetical protein